MKDYTDLEIIRGIARRKERIINHVYRTCYPDIRKLILTNTGNEHDAEDIFQEAMLKVYLKITEHGLKLTCQFNTYLYSVSRFLWLQELEKRKLSRNRQNNVDLIIDEQDRSNSREDEKLRIYESNFRELTKECQKVLNMYFQHASMEEICVAMGYKNVQIAKDKKYRCKKTLMAKICNNPEFKKLQNEIHLAG
jgi:RNA polymerase sigma factor (sigma-70 family)